jgi:hypothetical protein
VSSLAEELATDMWAVARSEEQCARVIPDEQLAAAVRSHVRSFAQQDGVKIRTARLDDTVVVVRLDAKIWTDDTATMRRKLTPARDVG